MLVADQIGYTYPGASRPTFMGVSFELPRATTCAIVGPSGVGKTTLLGVVSGLLRPLEGEVRVSGEAVDGSTLTRSTAWVTQDLTTLRARSVLDNCTLLGRIDGMHTSEEDRKARRLLAELGLGPSMGSRPAGRLSGGELQRLAIVRALISHRPLLIADEPTSHLDRATARKAIDALTGRNGANAAQARLFVTHDDDLADACDLVLELGQAGLERIE